jgi:non-specific serine/threonine protein kinase/serine/threonine-protein kinase
MTREEWARITDLLGDVLDLPPDARAPFLTHLRTSDPVAAVEVASLLEQHEQPGDFLPDFPAQLQPAADVSGRTIGAYRLRRLLGSGGMGSVYLAERSDGAFSKQVAVKLLSPALAGERDRFHREREMLARLEHPNIARLLDGGTTTEGWPYLVMEYVDGLPIDRYCAERNLSLDDRLALLLQVCDGVAHAHQRLVIHCDIKPENILVTPEGTAKLLDFGIAKLLDRSGHVTQFRPATPAFSSPEQLQGQALTTASDVYAIGVLGYVVLTGHWPYSQRPTHIMQAMQAVLTTEPIPASRQPGLPATRVRHLRGDLENVLAKAVAKEPNRRYASAQQLADDLDAFRRGFPVRARPDAIVYRVRRFIGRHRFASAAAVLATISLVGAVMVSTREARLAARRFDDLREFARVIVFDVDDVLSPIPGTTAARKLVVDTALEYLDRLGGAGDTDEALHEELAAAYIRVGKVQGGAFLPNLGDTKGAISSFGKAIAAVGPSPASPVLERLRIEGHINIALLATDPIQGDPEFDRAIAAGERQLAVSPDDVATLRLMAQAYHGKATIAHVTNQAPDHLRAVIRAVEIREHIRRLSPDSWRDRTDLAREYAQHALALMQTGEAETALDKLQQARAVLDGTLASAPSNQVVIRGLAEIRSRVASVLLALGRQTEAVAELDAAIGLLTPLVASDADNLQYKADLAYAWLRLGDVRRSEGRLSEALAWHQRALQVRRERAGIDSAFMFVPWEFTRSLNTVGELLLEIAPANATDARRSFEQARDVALKALAEAPSFNELRKQLAISYEGLARAALASPHADTRAAAELLTQSAATWREVSARSVGERRQDSRLETVERLLASLPSSLPAGQ